MSHQVCHDIGKWVDEEITQQVEKCVEQDCDWWCACCNKWFCFLVWVVVVVAKWVVETVCEIVADVVDVIIAIVLLIVNIVVGIVTWDFGRIWDALVDAFSSVVGLAWDVVRLMTLGSLVGEFRDRANKWSLRNYVRGLIDNNRAYTSDEKEKIKKALGIDGGDGFGFRLRVTAYRGFVRSDQVSGGAMIPDLVAWNNASEASGMHVDLKTLAGFKWTTFLQRGRPEIKGDFSESDVAGYLVAPTSRSVFTIYCMSESIFEDKLSAAEIKADSLGLKLQFDKRDLQLRMPNHVRMGPSPAAIATMLQQPPFSRTLGAVNMATATMDLCVPIVIGSFLYTDNSYQGYSAHLASHPCVDDGGTFTGNDLTGCNFRDRVPDFAFRWVPIHELGHTFGLCHVDGVERIMVSSKGQSLVAWWTIPEYWLSGEPVFTYSEAKSVWDYIIANFSAACLSTPQWS